MRIVTTTDHDQCLTYPSYVTLHGVEGVQLYQTDLTEEGLLLSLPLSLWWCVSKAKAGREAHLLHLVQLSGVHSIAIDGARVLDLNGAISVLRSKPRLLVLQMRDLGVRPVISLFSRLSLSGF